MQVPLSDIQLWNAMRHGDREAFGLIYEQYSAELLNYGYRVTASRQLIRDSVHDLFLHLWTHRQNLSETDSIRFYLFRALRNRIIRNRGLYEAAPDTGISEAEEERFPEFSIEQHWIEDEETQDRISRLKNAIAALSPRQQEIIQLRYFYNLGIDEIASLLAISNQSTRNLLHRALSQLRTVFEMAGGLVLLLFRFF